MKPELEAEFVSELIQYAFANLDNLDGTKQAFMKVMDSADLVYGVWNPWFSNRWNLWKPWDGTGIGYAVIKNTEDCVRSPGNASRNSSASRRSSVLMPPGLNICARSSRGMRYGGATPRATPDRKEH